MKYQDIKNGRFYLGDCLEIMKEIPDGCIDMILCDLPYGTTSCSWDSIIPFEPLWNQYERLIKENGAIVLTATQPFSSALVMSNPELFKYEWLWDKVSVTGFANAKKQPLRHIETILVFYKKPACYNPQGLIEVNKKRKNSATDGGETVKGAHVSNGKGSLRTAGLERTQQFTNYPKQLIQIGRDKEKLHPTQKPVELFKYLIRTYTNEGELILDNCAGSGTTAIAAENTGRKWVCIEQDERYANKAVERILKHEAELGSIDKDVPLAEGQENE